MPWVYLILAGGFEVAWVAAMARSEGFSRPWISVACMVLMLASVYLLSLAVKNIPVGTAYAVWTSIGVVGAVAIGAIFYEETLSAPKVLSIFIIIIGIMGLKLTGAKT